MRTVFSVGVILFPLVSFGRAEDSAKAVIERAIQAQGGAEALKRTHNLTRTGAGTMNMAGKDLPFTEETTQALPDRYRIAVDLDKQFQITLILNGDKGWQVVGGTSTELGKERIAELKEELYIAWVASLTPLLGKEFKLTALPDGTLDKNPVEMVQVASKGHFDAMLSFDKRSHMLARIERKTREAGLLLDKTYLFSNFQDASGAKLPGRHIELLNGRPISERTSAKFKLLDRPDDALFGKP